MFDKGKIKDDFFRKRILRDRIYIIVLSAVLLILFYLFLRPYLVYLLSVIGVLILFDLPSIFKGYRRHRELLAWLNRHNDVTILAYSTKVKYLDLIERHIIPNFPSKVIVVKVNENRVSGNIRRSVWLELANKTKVQHLPALIKIHNRTYQIIQLRRFLNEHINHEMDEERLQETFRVLATQPMTA